MDDDEPELFARGPGAPSPVEGVSQERFDEIAEEITRWARLPLHVRLNAIRRDIDQLRWSDRWAERFRGP